MTDKVDLILKSMISRERYTHSKGVQKTAANLAGIYSADAVKASIAGLLHDCAKDLPDKDLIEAAYKYGVKTNEIMLVQPELLHGFVGSYIVREKFNISDDDIIHAIRFHTTGCENMTILDKIIYLADYIEPGRSFPGVDELRSTAYRNLDNAVLLAMDMTIKYVIESKKLLDMMTVNARNYLIIDIKNT